MQHGKTNLRTSLSINKFNFILALCCFSILASEVKASSFKLKIWTRKTGDYSNDEGGKIHKQRVTLNHKKCKEKELFDVQYQSKYKFCVFSLESIIERASRQEGDLMLLHFSNGMIVPFPRDGEMIKKLNGHIAIDIQGSRKKWMGDFPFLSKDSAMGLDPHPLEFKKNKFVTASNWHPNLEKTGEQKFSPWREVDDLIGIEFAEKKAYERQFAVHHSPTPAEKYGHQVFLNRCQYCHSVQDVGAKYAWDFIRPIPLHQYKSAKTIFRHVTLGSEKSFEEGLMMPQQKGFKKKDLAGLWKWNQSMHEDDNPQPYVQENKVK